MSHRLRTGALGALLFCAIASPFAGAEDAKKPTPAEAFRTLVASFGAPTAARAFTIKSGLVSEGSEFGTVVWTAEVADWKGKAVWRLREQVELTIAESKYAYDETGLHSSRLSVISGKSTSVESGVKSSASFSRTAGGFSITEKTGNETKTMVARHKGDALNTLASFVQFCRMAIPGKATYACHTFDATPREDGEYIQGTRIEVLGEGAWKGKKAWLARGAMGPIKIRIAFEPETRAFLGMTMKEKDGLNVEFVGKSTSAVMEEWSLDAPASTPKRAALVVALAYGTGNFDLLSRMTHWPTAANAYNARHPAEPLTEKVLKASVKTGLAKARKQPRDRVIFALGTIDKEIKVSVKGTDRATVTLPKSFGGLVFQLGRIRGHWMLMDIPGT